MVLIPSTVTLQESEVICVNFLKLWWGQSQLSTSTVSFVFCGLTEDPKIAERPPTSNPEHGGSFFGTVRPRVAKPMLEVSVTRSSL